MRIDLHTHSRASDGTDSPAELVRAAAAAGLDVVAITDHDTADGWAEARAEGERVGIEVVPGMEISTQHRGRGVHLLAYFPDPDYAPLAAELGKVLHGRASRVPTMVERLNGLGIDITEDDVRDASLGAAASGRPHVADALVTLGVVPDRTAAFDRYLGWGRPAHVDRYAVALEDAITLVRESGGLSVVAHPWGRGGLGRLLRGWLGGGLRRRRARLGGPRDVVTCPGAVVVTACGDDEPDQQDDHDRGHQREEPPALPERRRRRRTPAVRLGQRVRRPGPPVPVADQAPVGGIDVPVSAWLRAGRRCRCSHP